MSILRLVCIYKTQLLVGKAVMGWMVMSGLCLLASLAPVQAQTASQQLATDSLSLQAPERRVIIDKIFLVGNKKTKDKIILRELSIAQGESYNYSDLEAILETDRNKIYNTRLFNTVEVGILDLDFDLVDIVIDVNERWYLFPIPVIDLIDRNFNDWWVNYNHDFSRIIYGLSLYHFNMRGMNERMTVTAQFGFSRRFEIDYSMPYIDKSQRNGLDFSARYIEYTNLHYNNIDNKRVFFESDKLLKTNVTVGTTYTRRKSFFTRHNIDFRYSTSNVADTILALNPNYLGIPGNDQKFFTLGYSFNHDKRDIAAYPLHGYMVKASILKKGLGIFNDVDILSISAQYARYMDLGKGFYLSNFTAGYLSTPNNQPYSEVQGLGFSNSTIRGYELYVIHGQNTFINKTTFKKQLFAGNTNWKKFPIKQFQYFPYALYIKTYFDFGYSKNTQNYEGNAPLADHVLYGTGIGLDFVTMYDIVIRLEYSFNSIGEDALFFHIVSEF